MKTARLLLALLAACGGRIADEPAPAPDPCAAMACATLGSGGHGDYYCPDGAMIYVCCDLTQAEIEHLIDAGETPARQCLAH